MLGAANGRGLRPLPGEEAWKKMAMSNLLQTANQMLSTGISKEFYDLVKNISESQSRQVRAGKTKDSIEKNEPFTMREICGSAMSETGLE